MAMVDGSRQLGKYRNLEELGRGGFATVYKALDTTLNREVALKILHPQLLTEPRFVRQFQHEAQTVAGLRHSHIVTIYEVGEADGRTFIIVYEMLTGDVLFKSQTLMQAVYAHSLGPQFPASWPEDVPQGIAPFLSKALARQPAERYRSAGMLWQALVHLEAQERAAREQADRTAREAEQQAAVAAQWRAEAERSLANKDIALAHRSILLSV
jgi:serine/threonine protein kinase